MKTFEDLKFDTHPCGSGKRASLDFDNGYGVSVIGGGTVGGFMTHYGDGVNTFEMAVTCGGSLCYDTPVTDDVLPHRSKAEITDLMRQVQELPPVSQEGD